MSKRARNLRGSYSSSLESEENKNAPRKRSRMVGYTGESFAHRMNKRIKKDKTEPIVIQDTSDEEVPGEAHQGKRISHSDISSLRSSPISEFGSNVLGRRSADETFGAQDLAKKYDQGKPDFGSDVEPDRTTETRSGTETSEGGSYAMQCLASAEKDLRLEHEEITKRMEEDRIKQKKLGGDLSSVRESMKVVGDRGL